MVALRGLEPVTLTLPGAGGTLNRSSVLPSLREGIDTSNATGRTVAGVLASLAELELVSRNDYLRGSCRARRHA